MLARLFTERGNMNTGIQETSLTSERLRLTPAKLEDAVDMVAAIDARMAQNLSFFSEPLTMGRQLEYLDRMTREPGHHLFCIREKYTKYLIGTIGLHEHDMVNDTARLGLLIFQSDDRHRGYGQEAVKRILWFAFENLGVNRVYIQIFSDNSASRKLFSDMGFAEEGILRDAYKLRDKYHDMRVMSMLWREWFKQV